MRGLRWAAALLTVLAAAGTGWAGWEIEQVHYNLRASGEEIYRHKSTMTVSKGRVRIADDDSVTIFDYANDRIRWILPKKKLYWEGTSDEYLLGARQANPRGRLQEGAAKNLPTPVVEVQDSGLEVRISDRPTRLYQIHADSERFQEVWVTETIDISADLDQQRFEAMQQKLAGGLRTGRTVAIAELNKDPLYRKAVLGGFPMRTHTFLGKAVIGTEVLRVEQREIPDSAFEVPPAFLFAPISHMVDEQRDPPAILPSRTPKPEVSPTPATRR